MVAGNDKIIDVRMARIDDKKYIPEFHFNKIIF